MSQTTKLTPGEARKKHAKTFLKFWAAFPKHVAPSEAERVYCDMVENQGLDPVQLIKAATAFSLRCGDDLTYVPSAHSWLKQGRYDDADLFEDEKAAAIKWLRQQWTLVNVKAVENKYHVSYERPYPPDDFVGDEAALKFFYQESARSWISDVYRSKLSPSQTESTSTETTPTSPPSTTSEQNSPSSELCSTPQESLPI